MSEAERWTIESPRFGSIEVEASALIDFDALPGFPDLRRFAVLQHDRESDFGWLQSLEQPEVAFPVIDPRPLFPIYRPALRAVVLNALEAKPTDNLDWLAIATVREGSVTLNLAAPLLVNPISRRGVQAILEGDEWSTREPLASVPTEPTPTVETTQPAVQTLRPAAQTSPPAAQTESKPQMKRGQGSRPDNARS